MVAKIYRPSRNLMQSGKGKSNNWVLVFDQESAKEIEPLIGYTSSTDTKSQVRLSFETLDEAKSYATNEGIIFRVEKPHESTPKQVSYPDNFKTNRKTPWTH